MLQFKKEQFCDFFAEVQPLLWDHWQEVATNKGKIPLDPDWSLYLRLEDMDLFVSYSIRDEWDNLLGYSWYFVNQHIHYLETKVAINDIVYLKPECRKGFTGIKFLKFCEEELKKIGVNKVAYHVKTAHNFGPVLERMKYKPVEINYEKYIGE